jgi:hypothetical protein
MEPAVFLEVKFFTSSNPVHQLRQQISKLLFPRIVDNVVLLLHGHGIQDD